MIKIIKDTKQPKIKQEQGLSVVKMGFQDDKPAFKT